jgi:hypothetical protein
MIPCDRRGGALQERERIKDKYYSLICEWILNYK